MTGKISTAEFIRFHSARPDFHRPLLQIPRSAEQRIRQKLESLYGNEHVEEIYRELSRLMKVYYAYKTPLMLEWEKQFRPEDRFTERDVILITYGDLVRRVGESPLVTLRKLTSRYLKGVFNTIHLLPFFPYSSDRGFAVIDFEQVDPQLGTWDDILDMKRDFKLMFDGVFNHVSAESRWFQEFLNQNPEYVDFFSVFDTRSEISPDHLKLIVRPRTSDVLSTFQTLNGPKLVWTTFSPDQIDLNFKNPRVLLKIVDILLTYVRRGADIIRLDAVTYLWEELGTSCVHLEQSHAIIRLFRDVLDVVAPHVALITETNVPHEENVRYFSNGYDEAQMVYNFALPPLVLHAFHTGDASRLTQWAASLKFVSPQATYFNFLDSHDGIGVMAVKNILSSEEIDALALRVVENGGFISYKDNGDGTVSPYELNVTWWNALNNDRDGEPVEQKVRRYLASRAIALVMMGVPGVYLHGLLGSRNDVDAVLEEQQTRSINRRNLNMDGLIRLLRDASTTTHQVATGLVALIRHRVQEAAFHPNAEQRILSVSPGTFTVVRTAAHGQEQIVAITNVTSKPQRWGVRVAEGGLIAWRWRDLLTGKSYQAQQGQLELMVEPYQVMWLKGRRERKKTKEKR